MTPIEVRVATLPLKLIAGCACVLIVSVVLWWGTPKFTQYLRVVTGREPRKPGTQTIHLVLSFFVYAIIFAPAVIAVAIFTELMTTPPSVVSEDGVAGGGGWLLSRKTIAWDEVQRVDCLLARSDHSVNRLRVIAGAKRVEFAGGNDLTGVRNIVWAHVPKHAVRSCYVPLGRNY